MNPGWWVVLAWLAVAATRFFVHWLMEPSYWWIKTDHTWYSRVSCAAGIHWRGSSGMSCMHNITVCHHCGKDVLWVVKDEAQ